MTHWKNFLNLYLGSCTGTLVYILRAPCTIWFLGQGFFWLSWNSLCTLALNSDTYPPLRLTCSGQRVIPHHHTLQAFFIVICVHILESSQALTVSGKAMSDGSSALDMTAVRLSWFYGDVGIRRVPPILSLGMSLAPAKFQIELQWF